MIAETVELSTSFQSVNALITDTRETDPYGYTPCSNITLKYAGTAVVSMKELESQSFITVLDGTNGIKEFSFGADNYDRVYLKAASAVDVEILIEQ